VKGEDLNVPSRSNTNLDDPRPAIYQQMEGYNSFVRNHVTNYCFVSGKDLAIRYTWDQADIQEAVKDHDYLKLPYTEYWVDDANKVNYLSDKNIFILLTQSQQRLFLSSR